MPTNRHDKPRVGEPLVKRPVTKRTRFQPQSVIPGIPHMIEGMPQFSKVETRTRPSAGQAVLRGDRPGEAAGYSYMEDKGIKRQMQQFRQRQKARQSVVSIQDPMQGVQERRRAAARKRMRGRLGTLLSQRESLS